MAPTWPALRPPRLCQSTGGDASAVGEVNFVGGFDPANPAEFVALTPPLGAWPGVPVCAAIPTVSSATPKAARITVAIRPTFKVTRAVEPALRTNRAVWSTTPSTAMVLGWPTPKRAVVAQVRLGVDDGFS